MPEPQAGDPSPGNKDQMRLAIEQELEEGFRRKEDYLANFRGKLPCSDELSSPMDYRKVVEPVWDKPWGEIIKDEADKKGHSELYLGQTPRQFYQAFDVALGDDLPVARGKWEELKRSLVTLPKSREEIIPRSERQDRIREELNEILKPAFVKLKMQGYTTLDLKEY